MSTWQHNPTGLPTDLMEEVAVVSCGGCSKGNVPQAAFAHLGPQAEVMSLPALVANAPLRRRRLELAHALVAISACPEDCASKLLVPLRVPDIKVNLQEASTLQDMAALNQTIRALCNTPKEATEVLRSTLDCVGLKCPMPIIKLSSESRRIQWGEIEIQADDPAFPSDLEAWCSQRNAQLQWQTSPTPGLHRAKIVLQRQVGQQRKLGTSKAHHNPAQPTPSAQKEPRSSQPANLTVNEAYLPQGTMVDSLPILAHLDCKGMKSPLQIAQLQRSVQKLERRGLLVIETDDPAFRNDIKTWCIQTQSQLVSLEDQGGLVKAVVAHLQAPSVAPDAKPETTTYVSILPEKNPNNEDPHGKEEQALVELDYRGLKCPMPILRLKKDTRSSTSSQFKILANDAAFPADLEAWCGQAGATILSMEKEGEVHTALIVIKSQQDQPPQTNREEVHKSPPPHRPWSKTDPVPLPTTWGNNLHETSEDGSSHWGFSQSSFQVSHTPSAWTSIQTPTATQEEQLDYRGMKCPLPIIRLTAAARNAHRSSFVIQADDPAFPADIQAWCDIHGYSIVEHEMEGSTHRIHIERIPLNHV